MLRNTLRRSLHCRCLSNSSRICQEYSAASSQLNNASTHSPHTPTSNESSVLLRLNTVAELLDMSKRFKYTSLECFELYQEEEATLIDDLLDSPSHQAHQSIVTNFRKSKLLAAFVLDQLCTIIIKRRYVEAISFFRLMSTEGILSRKGAKRIDSIDISCASPDELLNELTSVLVMENLRLGEPLVAALCALKLHDYGAVIDTTSLTAIISSLSVSTPQRRTYHSYTIVKLFEIFKDLKMPPRVKVDAIKSMLGGPVVPFFANTCYDKLVEQKVDVETYLLEQLTRDIIQSNLECGNLLRCVHLWKKAYLENNRFASDNVALFASLVDALAVNDSHMAISLIEQYFPMDLQKHPQVINSLLAIYGQTSDYALKFEILTHELQPPLLRKTLSLLFASFLYQSNENAAERILQAIFGTKNGLNFEDFQTIVQRLLCQQKIKQTISMCSSTDIQVSKGGYVKAVEFLLTHTEESLRSSCDMDPKELNETREKFLLQAARKFKILPRDDQALKDLTVSIFKYLSGNVSNGASRKLYIISSHPENSPQPYYAFQRFLMPDLFNDLVYIDKSNRLRCLSIILNQAISDKDKTTLKWSVVEMAAMGLLPLDIKNFYLSLEEVKSILAQH